MILQVFKPYNSPYTLPIPASAKSSATTTAPNVNYTDASSGGVMALAGGTMTNFALRFTGEPFRRAAAFARPTWLHDRPFADALIATAVSCFGA